MHILVILCINDYVKMPAIDYHRRFDRNKYSE